MTQQGIKRLLVGAVVLFLVAGVDKPLTAMLNPIQSETQRGNLALARSNFSLARSHYRTALRALFKPGEKKMLLPWRKTLELQERAKLRNNLGLSYAAEGKFEKAQLEYRTALKLFELSQQGEKEKGGNALAELFFNQGNAFFQQKQYEKAVKAYLNSLALRGEVIKTRYNLELALRQLIQKEEKQARQQTLKEEQVPRSSTGTKTATAEIDKSGGRNITAKDSEESANGLQPSPQEGGAGNEQREALETTGEQFSKEQAEAILEQLQKQKKRKKIPFFNEEGETTEGKLW